LNVAGLLGFSTGACFCEGNHAKILPNVGLQSRGDGGRMIAEEIVAAAAPCRTHFFKAVGGGCLDGGDGPPVSYENYGFADTRPITGAPG